MTDRSWQDLKLRNEHRCQRILAKSALLETADLDWDRVADSPLPDEAVHTLVYMRDVENFTYREFSGLSAHPATWGDPLVGQFLHCWQAEEREHARALGRFLDGYAAGRGIDLPPMQDAPQPVESGMEKFLVTVSRPVGHVVTAAHMTWGATNELLTLNGYRLLGERAPHPVLSPLLTRIMSQESRHYSFYVLQAEWRLAASRLARVVIRQMLNRSWTPVGVGPEFKRPEEFRTVLDYLVAGASGRRTTARMDRIISELPGLDGLGLFHRVVGRAA